METGEPKSMDYQLQRFSVAVQCGNSASGFLFSLCYIPIFIALL